MPLLYSTSLLSDINVLWLLMGPRESPGYRRFCCIEAQMACWYWLHCSRRVVRWYRRSALPLTCYSGITLLVCLDTLADIEVVQACGFRIIFFSYQWLSWNQPGPNNIQWEWMQTALGLYCVANGRSMEKTYVWLDIFSIPHFHDGCLFSF